MAPNKRHQAASAKKKQGSEDAPVSPKVNKLTHKQKKRPSALASSESVVVPLLAVIVGVIGTVITLGAGGRDPVFAVKSLLDANSICNAVPFVCEALNLARLQHDQADGGHDDVGTQVLDLEPVFNLEFYNRLPYDVHTFWKDYDGVERFWFGMEPFSYHGNITSVPGHVWVFRLASTDQILFEEMIETKHCGKIMIAPPEHVEALRQYCQDTGRAVLGHWPRAGLVRNVPSRTEIGDERQFETEHAQFHDSRSSAESSVLTVKTLSQTPHLLEIDNFLSNEECDHLIELAKSSDELSQKSTDEVAGSSVWIEHGETPIIAAISRRIFDVMGFEDDVETFFFAEKLQISHFGENESYAPHFDSMDMTTSQRHLPHNRYASLWMYLNDVDENNGGADVFPRADFRDEYAGDACDSKLRVQPKKGKLVILYSMLKDGNIDETSLHGSCPIIGEGAEKWTSSMFLWDPFVQWTQM